MRTSAVILAAALANAAAFQPAPLGPRRATLALRSTSPSVGSADGLSEAMVDELKAEAAALDRTQKAQTLALLGELRARGDLSEAQYATELAKVEAGTAFYLKPQAKVVPVPPSMEKIHALEAQVRHNSTEACIFRYSIYPPVTCEVHRYPPHSSCRHHFYALQSQGFVSAISERLPAFKPPARSLTDLETNPPVKSLTSHHTNPALYTTCQGFSYLGALRALALTGNDEQAALSRLEVPSS